MIWDVLVVEDHKDIGNLLALHLRDMDCQVTIAHDGNAGLTQANNHSYDLMVLDWMLPGISGIDICREIRQRGNRSPVMMLTANAMEGDRVIGLDAGADDYVTKPFSIPEFLARVRAVFRRTEAFHKSGTAISSQNVYCVHELSIDADKRLSLVAAKSIDLTAIEFDLLLYLARHPGQVFSRQQLLDAVWGSGFDGYEHTVNSHINRLRAKIENDPADPEYIVTVWGVGYKMPEHICH